MFIFFYQCLGKFLGKVYVFGQVYIEAFFLTFLH